MTCRLDLKYQFHEAMIGITAETKESGYFPSHFIQMVAEQGGLSAAKQLLSRGNPASGFVRLWEEQRLDLSVEALVLKEPWCALFADEELDVARRRLEELGYDPEGST